MTIQMQRPPTLSAPATTPLPGTLLSAATITEGVGWLEPFGLFETYNCLTMETQAVFPCPDGVQPEKEFSDPNWQDGIRFAVYGGLRCMGVGLDPATEAQIRRVFLDRESVGVERALMQSRFVAGDTWDAAVDLTPTPGTAVTPQVGLALLEGDAAAHYAGVPTIHAPRTVGSLLMCCSVERVGDKFFSKQGSKVASGGGYGSPSNGPDGTQPADGTMWMYATGEVSLARGDLIVVSELERTTNDYTTLVERMYVATVDCYTSAVLVSVEEV